MQNTDRMLGLAALAALVLGCFVVLFPFGSPLLWAIILAYSTWPLYVRLRTFLRGRSTLAAALMTLGTSLVLLAPFVIVALGLADNAAELVDAVRGAFARGLPDLPGWMSGLPLVGERMDSYWKSIAHDGGRLVEELKRWGAPARDALVAGGRYLGAGLVQLALSVLIAFFLFRDGEAIAAWVGRAGARVGGVRARRLMDVAGHTVSGVVYGILGTAIAQGVLAGIGFAIAGVPGASLLGLATFFLSVVPVGPPLIWGSATLWLYYQGAVGWAVFMGLWGLLVVSMVDNFLKPAIISRGSRLPFILVFLGVLGGVLAFGFIGVFLGPTLLAVGYRLLSEWLEEEKGPQKP